MNDKERGLKVSIIIPTYNRPKLLLEALQSVWDQIRLPYEIVIGDDSNNKETANLVYNRLIEESPVNLRYFHNSPSLGQAMNIQMLFNEALGDKVVLLHDDDLLLPLALHSMCNCFLQNPLVKVVFGKQYLIEENGGIDIAGSQHLNEHYFRSKRFEGEVLLPIEAGFLQQLPNDGYMIDVSVLPKVNYRTSSPCIGDLGYGCEYDFGVQLGVNNYRMFFLNEYLLKYRLSTTNSISSSSFDDAGLKAFLILYSTTVPSSSQSLKEVALRRKIAVAVSQASRLNKEKALRLFFSKWHRRKIFTLGGIRRFLMIVFLPVITKRSKIS